LYLHAQVLQLVWESPGGVSAARKHLIYAFTHFLLNEQVLVVKLCWAANHLVKTTPTSLA
jgi:hypothetical protein